MPTPLPMTPSRKATKKETPDPITQPIQPPIVAPARLRSVARAIDLPRRIVHVTRVHRRWQRVTRGKTGSTLGKRAQIGYIKGLGPPRGRSSFARRLFGQAGIH